MQILIANLKHFYQRRILYAFYVPFGMVALGFVYALVLKNAGERGEFASFVLAAFVAGLMAGFIEREVASRPFLFSLPGHRRTIRNLVFVVGIMTSLALALPWMAYPGLSSVGPTGIILIFVSVLCTNLFVYMIASAVALDLMHARSMINFIVLAIVLAVVLSRQIKSDVAIVQRILYHPEFVPLSLIVLAALTSGAVWWGLGRPAWFRRQCAVPWVGFLDPWDRRQAHKFRRVWTTRRFRKAPHPGVNAFFLERIRRCSESDPRRAVWGMLYTTFALMEPQWKGLLLLVWTAVIWAGCAPRAAPFLVPVVALMLTGFMNPPVYSELPVVGSRRERAFATMAQILALAGFSTLIVGLSILVLNRLMPLVPVIEVADFRLSYQPIDFRLLLPLVVAFPMMGMVRVLFHRNPMALMLGTTLLLGGMALAAVLVQSLPPAYVAAAAGALWVACFAVVHRIATRSDLVRR